MCDYHHKYKKYKSKYINLKSQKQIMYGGRGENLDPEFIKKIDTMAEEYINKIKTIGFGDLCGLNKRVYERKNGKKISPIIFIPPKINEYIDKISSTPIPMGFSFNFGYSDYYEKKYGDITKNKFKDLIFDFDTDKSVVNVAFRDNYPKKNKTSFKINLPIKLIDFIEKLFDHFDLVGLEGYPDNGGIDCIVYDKTNDIYLVNTWS